MSHSTVRNTVSYRLGIICALLAAAGVLLGERAWPQDAPPVDVARPIVKTIVDWDEYTGRFEAVERVEVRARVSGVLEAVHFRDGELVEQGALLFTIDPRPFAAEVARAEAELSVARAQLELSVSELRRVESLLDSRAISREEVDIRRANQMQAQASVEAAEAVLRAAVLNLEFTDVKAPIAGRMSNRRVDVGNLISGGSAQSTLLTTVVKLDPIYFVFDASEADFLRYARLSRSGRRPSSREAANPVQVRLMDETEWDREGKMDFVNNELNPDSGTIRGRAIFDNPDRFLTPGVFGRMRLLGSGEYEALLLPDKAVLSDQSDKIVMSVADDGTVTPKVVKLGPLHDGLRVIREGVEPSDRVIVNGLLRARPGAKVTPEEVQIQTSADAAADGRVAEQQ